MLPECEVLGARILQSIVAAWRCVQFWIVGRRTAGEGAPPLDASGNSRRRGGGDQTRRARAPLDRIPSSHPHPIPPPSRGRGLGTARTENSRPCFAGDDQGGGAAAPQYRCWPPVTKISVPVT